MTHQNHLTNGASLEDCHTNFFALTDLCGIKWRKLVLGERPNATGDPLDDPVLSSYSRCLAVDILCVWRRVAAPRQEPDSSANMFDLNLTVSGNSGSVTHPPLSLTAAKELWIFWYGEEPDLTELLAPELQRSSEGVSGSWESGITYECRSLLFKALHNLIERCLLSKDVVRLGRWFVQPCSNNECRFGKSPHHLSYSFAFFVHGESTVCASMDLRVHPTVRPLTPEYLAEAAALQQQQQQQQQQSSANQCNNNLGNGGLSGAGTSTSSSSSASSNADLKPKPVILAPFGLAATLTGQSFRALDPITQKAYDDWCSFYPLCNRENANLPQMVEVIIGGVKMRYPSKYVLTTDLDDEAYELKCKTVPPMPITEKAINDLTNPNTMHQPVSVATVLPERIWQDCISNPLGITSTALSLSSSMASNPGCTVESPPSPPPQIKEEPGTVPAISASTQNDNSNPWDFVDPTQKATCLCTKPTVPAGGTTPGGGSLSYLRNPHSIPESLTAIPSVGSPGSAGPSPHPNSALSQPTSVPPPDQMMAVISPMPPMSASNLQPSTPIDSMDKNTPAATPTDPQDCKSNTASPYVGPAPPSVEPPPGNLLDQIKVKSEITGSGGSSAGNNTGGGNGSSSGTSSTNSSSNSSINSTSATNIVVNSGSSSNSSSSSSSCGGSGNTCNTGPSTANSSSSCSSTSNVTSDLKSILALLKRPILGSRDYENIVDDDYMPQQLLYDYSTWDAWMNHPVKRYKPNDESKLYQNRQRKDLYEGLPHTTTAGAALLSTAITGQQPHMAADGTATTTTTSTNPTTSMSVASPSSSSAANIQLMEQQIKSEPMIGSSGGSGDELIHDIKKEPVDGAGDGDAKVLTESLYTSKGLQASYTDLEQIFDEENSGGSPPLGLVHTPPRSNKSMSGGCQEDTKRYVSNTNLNNQPMNLVELTKMFPTPPSLEQHHPNSSPFGASGMPDQQIDIVMDSPKMSGHGDDEIEDWSYVFVPQQICKFVGSSKYAPLTNLPSQSQPLSLPSNIAYKPSWQQQQQQQSLNNATNPNSGNPTNNNNNSNINNNNINKNQIDNKPLQQQLQQQHHMMQMQQQQQLQQQLMQQQHLQQQQLMNVGPGSVGGMLTPRPLSRPSSVHSLPGSSSGMMNFGGPSPGMSMNNMHMAPGNIAMRPDMSPISPATAGGPPYTAGGMSNSPMNPYRRNVLPPPPPYELAVASPATSTSSYLNKQFNSDGPSTPSINRVPEANALLLNILLYDTALNVFKDHNFDSCTLCVCNAGHKCVGNIRGSDSGVYLALPGTTFDPSSLYTNNSSGGNSNSNSNNCFGGYGIDSPAGGLSGTTTNHNVGYQDYDPIKCSCGFSAVVNRRLAHRSGLFYEDELEITSMAEDPAQYKRNTKVSLILGESKVKIENGSNAIVDRIGGGGGAESNCDMMMSQVIMDLLQEQCTLVQSSCSSIQRAIRCFQSLVTIHSRANSTINMLEYTDAQDIIWLALDQSRLVFETQYQNRMDMAAFKPFKYNISGHKWPFVKAEGPRSNKDIIRIMKSMQPLLQDAFHKKCTTRLWDAPYTVQGPLTWRQFHRMASSSSGQCEPQPIPSLVVGHEKDWLSVSPYAIQYWDKFLLEPYSYSRDIAYIVVAPDNDYVVGRTKNFLKELSTTYEMCKLGRHNAIKGWDGVLRVSKTTTKCNSDGLDEWFMSLGDSKTSELLKMYAQTCQQQLVPYLSKIPNDKSLLDPPEGTNSTSTSNKDRSLPSPMLPPSTPDSSQASGDKAPSTPKSSDVDMDSQRDTLNTSGTQISVEPLGISQDEINPPCIVIYVVDPFSSGHDSVEEKRITCLALLRCYSNILASIPESVRSNINFQIISMESIMELGRSRDRLRFSDEMRCLALSIFSQCRRHIAHNANVKSLTGFGTAANMEIFLKNKDEKNRAAYKLYTPPYILSGRHEKSENTETFGTTSIEQQSSIMYCSYCLSEDQKWLLAVATDDRGELLETVTINIDIPNRRRRKKASARRYGLQKLMDFIIGVISQSGQPWRIVVGRIGRIGHGELKGWSWLLSKQNLMKASKQLKDICEQCSLMHPHSVPSILSACLVTLEPDSNLRVMPDKFTPDERFSQTSMQSPLSTPQDVTCTHILVFPTSAIAQSSQSAFQEQHINGFDEDGLFDLCEGDEDVNMNGIDEILDWDNLPIAQPSPERSRQGSPNGVDDNRSRQSPGPGGGACGTGRNGHSQDSEEVGSVLQQPLALGYLVSTAPTGRMPTWFWSSCPHLENVCPVFLKTALHLHSPSIQQNTDDMLHQNQSSANDHPLDSTFTADVLRYVLEGYNVLSWLAMDSNTHDRLSCLPIHVQVLMQLYYMTAAMA